MSLKVKVSEDLKSAMKEKNAVKLGVLRVLKAEIERAEQGETGKVDLTDEAIVSIVKKSIEGIKVVNGSPEEISTLEVYLPRQLREDEITDIIAVLKSEGKNMGQIMSYFKENFNGKYDGAMVSKLAKA